MAKQDKYNRLVFLFCNRVDMLHRLSKRLIQDKKSKDIFSSSLQTIREFANKEFGKEFSSDIWCKTLIALGKISILADNYTEASREGMLNVRCFTDIERLEYYATKIIHLHC